MARGRDDFWIALWLLAFQRKKRDAAAIRCPGQLADTIEHLADEPGCAALGCDPMQLSLLFFTPWLRNKRQVFAIWRPAGADLIAFSAEKRTCLSGCRIRDPDTHAMFLLARDILHDSKGHAFSIIADVEIDGHARLQEHRKRRGHVRGVWGSRHRQWCGRCLLLVQDTTLSFLTFGVNKRPVSVA